MTQPAGIGRARGAVTAMDRARGADAGRHPGAGEESTVTRNSRTGLSTARLVLGLALVVGGSLLFAGEVLPAMLTGRSPW
jgi:hypothetical protein